MTVKLPTIDLEGELWPSWPDWLLIPLDYVHEHIEQLPLLVAYQYAPKREIDDWWLNLEFIKGGGIRFDGWDPLAERPRVQYYFRRLIAAVEFYNDLVDPYEEDIEDDRPDKIAFCMARILEAVLDIVTHPQFTGWNKENA